jgi:hypothetical protein
MAGDSKTEPSFVIFFCVTYAIWEYENIIIVLIYIDTSPEKINKGYSHLLMAILVKYM